MYFDQKLATWNKSLEANIVAVKKLEGSRYRGDLQTNHFKSEAKYVEWILLVKDISEYKTVLFKSNPGMGFFFFNQKATI